MSTADQMKQQIQDQITKIKAMISSGQLAEAQVMPEMNALSQRVLQYVATSFQFMQTSASASSTNDKAKYEELKKLFDNSLGLWSGITTQIDSLLKQSAATPPAQ